ncbi:MAG: dockerin type I repeat-containing protein [Clostridia bacterium]|nr:dockerin type I repeat-containing protein [Clostridia bacterium]
MNKRKLISLLLAALMTLAVLPAAVFAKSLPEVQKDAEVQNVNTNYLNINGCLLTYTELNSTYPCSTGTQGDRKYVEITNGGHASTTAGFTSTSLMMAAGDKLYFDYWYSTELNYDYFTFTATYNNADHQEEHISGSTGGDDVWFTHTFIAPENAWYTFTWDYTKDGSGNTGSDCVRVSNVYLDVHWNYQRAEAVTKPGTGLFEYDFASGNYPFYTRTSDAPYHEAYLRSGNNNVASSYSQFAIYEHTRACTLSFDYAVSCEAASGSNYYDYFEVTVDGVSILKVAGSDDFSWYRCSHDLSQGWHLIVFKYTKDSSVNVGSDCACVDNITLDYPSSEAASRWFDINYLGSSSNKIYFTTPAGTAGWGTKIDEGGGNLRGYSNNRYLDDSNSVCETLINMQQGETLSFTYVVSSESTYDKLVFYANGAEQMRASGWTDRAWHTYTFTAPETGGYRFEWKYIKDGTAWKGWDYAYIRSVTYSGSYHQSLNLDNRIVSSQSTEQLHFETDPTYGHGFQIFQTSSAKDSEDVFAAISRNRYMESTTATMSANAGSLPAGTMIYFDYYVSSEADCDVLTFKVKKNGSTIINQELGSGDYGWHYYETTLSAAGNYEFIWEYSKDVNGDWDDDCAMITNVIVQRPMPSLDDALNSDETQQSLHFTSTGTYPFEVGCSGSSYYAYSTNGGVASSSSTMNSTATFQAGDTLSFYYYLDSESNYDWFNFYVNDQRLVHDSGEVGIQLYTWTAPSNGTYNLRWEYTKDSSTNSGEDIVRVMEVKVVKNGGTPGSGNGDVDGNGTVNVTDAVMALRHAMGIITLTSEQIHRGDVDGNGIVNVTDAITILRKAMGIIP